MPSVQLYRFGFGMSRVSPDIGPSSAQCTVTVTCPEHPVGANNL